MRNIRIDLQYDGTNYSGWQVQKNVKSIQEEIEIALSILTKEKIKIVGSGRTDAGVHALHQVASFKTNSKIPIEKFPLAINSKISEDIRIFDAFEVCDNFHARFSAKQRTYQYIINDEKVLSPFKRNFRWHRKKKIDDYKLARILNKIRGKYNFQNLCSINDESRNKTREIKEIQVLRKNGDISVFITANAFLRKMIRIIIGTSIKSIEKNLDENYLYTILTNHTRSNDIFTAEPQGLFLYKIEY